MKSWKGLSVVTSDQQAILVRLRRKAEVMKMEFKAQNNLRHHDMTEILLLIDMLERSG